VKTVGKYKIIEEIGRGGMGVVYKGIDPYIGRTLAIKTIRLDIATEDRSLEKWKKNFIREARIAGNLTHPNIVTIYDVGEDSGLFYIAMEYIEGQSLRESINSNKRFSPEEVKDLMDPICNALAYAHKKGVVHSDIKPENILLDKNGRIVIVDFGIARTSTSNITQTVLFMGTPSYMSPEHFKGRRLDARSDIFSIGTVFYEIITGHKALAGDNIATIIERIINNEPLLKATSINPDLPQAFDYIIEKALAKSPENRYQNCEDLLSDIINYETIHASMPFHENAPSAQKVITEYSTETIRNVQLPKIKKLEISRALLISISTLLLFMGLSTFYLVRGPFSPHIRNYRAKFGAIIKEKVWRDVERPIEVSSKGKYNEKTDVSVSVKEIKEHDSSQQVTDISPHPKLANKQSMPREYIRLGEQLLERGRYIKATDSLKEALRLKPDNYTAHYLLGKVYKEQGLFDKSIFEFENAISINKFFPPPYKGLAEIYEEKGEVKKAISYFHRYYEMEPNPAEIDEIKIRVAKIEAEIQESESRRQRNKLLMEHFKKGKEYYEEGNFSRAIFYLNEVLKLDPKHKDAKRYLELVKVKKFDSKIDSPGSFDSRNKGDAKLPKGF